MLILQGSENQIAKICIICSKTKKITEKPENMNALLLKKSIHIKKEQ